MKLFIDVGGHFGETLDEIFSLPHRFDVVHCLEPQTKCCSFIENKFAEQIAVGKLVVHNFGLANFDGEATLYGGDRFSCGASLFSDKIDIDSGQTEKCKFVKASSFVKKVVQEDNFAVMKLNCEGGEALILRDLMREGRIHSLNSIYVDFDICCIPSQADEQRKIITELESLNYKNYATWHEVQAVNTYSFSKRRKISRVIGGYGFPRIKIWLSQIEDADKIVNLGIMGRVVRHLPKFVWGRLYRARRVFRKRFLRKTAADK